MSVQTRVIFDFGRFRLNPAERLLLHYEWKFQEAEQEFKRAIDLNPNYSIAHHWLAFDLAAMGRMDEAVDEVRRARQTDPLSAIINPDEAEILYWARRYDEALQQASHH